MKPFHIALAAVSVTFLAVAITWPQFAETLLRSLLAILALSLVGARVYRAGLPVSITQDTYSPFESHALPERPSSPPEVVRHLTVQLAALGDAERAEAAPITGAAGRIIVAEAARRLAQHHGLSLDDPHHGARIRSLVSEPTWALIRPGESGSGTVSSPAAPVGSVALSRLERILDDLERL